MVLIGQLFFIQILKGDFYKAMAQGHYFLDEEIPGQRGEIFFNNGEALAVNMEWPLVHASPGEIEEKKATAELLAQIIDVDEEWLLEKLQKDNLYEILKKKISEEEINKIKELNLKGIYLKKESGRYYPQETLASQLVGFLGADKTGQYGIEGYYDNVLQGGRVEKGADIFLTVDYSIQFTAEKLLEKAKEDLNIESGEIIVIEPNTGKILALANFPNFNPNQYSQAAGSDLFRNPATQKIFEPGSIFKAVTMAAAINEGKINPLTLYLDPGIMEFDGWPIYNYDRRTYRGETVPEVTMTEVLEKSINTGAVFAQQQLGKDLFYEYIKKFKLFEKTNIDLQETVPQNKELHEGLKQKREINFATASYGQGIEMTPIQLVRAYAALANGGKLITPYLVEKKIKDEKEEIISVKAAAQITAMMVSTVENGFSRSARIPGYYVAGKTGTAQISFAALGINKKGYSDKTWQSFAGYAPAFNPRFLILVKMNSPEAKTAEYSALPVFHNLAKYIIDYYQIPPDYELD